MSEPFRVDTLKFTLDRSRPKPNSFEFESFLEESAKLKFDDVIGIHMSIVNSDVFVKLKSEELCNKVVQSCGGTLKFKHRDGNISEVQVTHAGSLLKTVRIFELPFEVPAAEIDEVVSAYGTIISNEAEKWSNAHKFPVLNGIRQLKVDLKKHIPSYINVCGYRAIVSYEGQPRTCAACGKAGHVRAECKQRRVAQLPAGEPVSPAAMTSMPLTYAAVANSHKQSSTISEINHTHSVTDKEVPMDIPETVEVGSATLQSTDFPTKPPTEQNREAPKHEEDISAEDTGTEPEQTGSLENPTISQKNRSRRKHKKRRIAHEGAEESAPLLREKAKQIASTISDKAEKNVDIDMPLPVPIPTASRVDNHQEGDQAGNDSNLHETNIDSSKRIFSKEWTDDPMDDINMSELADDKEIQLNVENESNHAHVSGNESDTY